MIRFVSSRFVHDGHKDQMMHTQINTAQTSLCTLPSFTITAVKKLEASKVCRRSLAGHAGFHHTSVPAQASCCSKSFGGGTVL